MISKEVESILNMLYESRRFFTEEELLTFVDTEFDGVSSVLAAIEKYPQFLSVKPTLSEERYIISKKFLHEWYVDLNVRLAKANTFKLDLSELTFLLSSLREKGQWKSSPTEIIEFGGKHLLISANPDESKYSFPLAYIISFMSPLKNRQSTQFLKETYDNSLDEYVKDDLSFCIKRVLEKLSGREELIITRRQGLLGEKNSTLESIGQELELTRERVRQIEVKCWRKLFHPSRSELLVHSLLSYLVCKNSGLVISSEEPINELRFITKCINIPMSRFPGTGLYVVGFEDEGTIVPRDIPNKELTPKTLSDFIRNQSDIPLTYEDLTVIIESLKQGPERYVTKSERVYQVLRQIGEPSHFAYVTEVYNEVFADDTSTERSIHAILGREEHGIVWIGIKGTYALREWGFERPSATIFDTIADIVEQKYHETNNPVSFVVIQAEIGKYRKLVNRNSLIMACYFNSRLVNVNKDCFIPSDAADNKVRLKNESVAEELDRKLKQFEIRIKRSTTKC